MSQTVDLFRDKFTNVFGRKWNLNAFKVHAFVLIGINQNFFA